MQAVAKNLDLATTSGMATRIKHHPPTYPHPQTLKKKTQPTQSILLQPSYLCTL